MHPRRALAPGAIQGAWFCATGTATARLLLRRRCCPRLNCSTLAVAHPAVLWHGNTHLRPHAARAPHPGPGSTAGYDAVEGLKQDVSSSDARLTGLRRELAAAKQVRLRLEAPCRGLP